jgi:hypothetical protein
MKLMKNKGFNLKPPQSSEKKRELCPSRSDDV